MAGRRTERRNAWLRVAIALPALLVLAAAPVSAAMPGLHLISICTAEGPQLVLLEGPDPASPDRDRLGHMQMACAHALCPRELLPVRKARSRT